MITCTFIGDTQIFRRRLDTDIEAAVESVLQSETEIVFLVGGLSEFEHYCSATVRRLRHLYSHLDIRLILVLPCANALTDVNCGYYTGFFDEVFIPNEICKLPQNIAIEARNRYMVDQSNEVIACVYKTSGTAFELLEYAKIKGKRIINFPDVGKKVRYIKQDRPSDINCPRK